MVKLQQENYCLGDEKRTAKFSALGNTSQVNEDVPKEINLQTKRENINLRKNNMYII